MRTASSRRRRPFPPDSDCDYLALPNVDEAKGGAARRGPFRRLVYRRLGAIVVSVNPPRLGVGVLIRLGKLGQLHSPKFDEMDARHG